MKETGKKKETKGIGVGKKKKKNRLFFCGGGKKKKDGLVERGEELPRKKGSRMRERALKSV